MSCVVNLSLFKKSEFGKTYKYSIVFDEKDKKTSMYCLLYEKITDELCLKDATKMLPSSRE